MDVRVGLWRKQSRRIDAFELQCWRRLLRVPWTARRFNQSNSLKEIRDQSWVFTEGRDVDAETPILWPPDAKSWLIWKDSDAGKIEGRRSKGWQRMRWLHSIADSMVMNLSKLRETVKDREASCTAVHGFEKSWTRLSDWTTTTNHSLWSLSI